MLHNFSQASNLLTKILRENGSLDKHKNAVKIYKIMDAIERIFNDSFEKMNAIIASDLSRNMKINLLFILKNELEQSLYIYFTDLNSFLTNPEFCLSLCMNISKTKYKQSLKKVVS